MTPTLRIPFHCAQPDNRVAKVGTQLHLMVSFLGTGDSISARYEVAKVSRRKSRGEGGGYHFTLHAKRRTD